MNYLKKAQLFCILCLNILINYSRCFEEISNDDYENYVNMLEYEDFSIEDLFGNRTEEKIFGNSFDGSTYNNSIYITDDIKQSEYVENFLSEENLKQFMDPSGSIYVRCPKQWVAHGPFCMTLSITQPYTECPFVKRVRRYSTRDPYTPIPDLPGICVREETIGVSYNCPDSFYLNTEKVKDHNDREVTYTDCRAYDAIPFHLLENSLNGYPKCPRGMVDDGYKQCSTVIQRLSPGVICPSTYTMEAEDLNDFSLNNKKILKCTRKTRTKGRLKCPEGYYITGELFANSTMGVKLPDEAFDNLKLHYTPSLETEIFYKYGLDVYENFKPTQAIVCAQVLSVLWVHCDKYQCKTPYLKELKNILLNWAFKWLATDATYILKTGIPGGRDVFQQTGVLRPFFDRVI